jgi:hypothetical protein
MTAVDNESGSFPRRCERRCAADTVKATVMRAVALRSCVVFTIGISLDRTVALTTFVSVA